MQQTIYHKIMHLEIFSVVNAFKHANYDMLNGVKDAGQIDRLNAILNALLQ